ncbi:MAG TPA: amidohydrolase family protein [Steroidobacteraceae bacterium]|jgi:N-acyl-D-amino-acid deacylase|nr:amidohydrolase family protein [Steroidobacteraceae bacterium]
MIQPKWLATLALLLPLAHNAAAGPASPSRPAAGSYDLWIRNGTVVDGTGRPRYAADVLVSKDKIAFIGSVAGKDVRARRVIDAHGDIVAPGFIDAHSHGDPFTQSFLNFLEQGITTVLLGQDGFTPNYDPDHVPAESLSLWMKRLDDAGSEVNVATLSGHGALRMLAGVGDAPVPTEAQMKLMEALLEEDLAAGAYGMSFGLEYEPGRYARLAEEKALGDLVGRRGGIVMSHMRSEDTGKIAGAIDELLQIDAHVHVSHMKIVAGRRAEEADAVLAQLARARAPGREVTGDVYPYLASASDFVFLYPDWAKREEDYRKAVQTRRPELEAHIRKRVAERNGPGAILITEGKYAGLTLEAVAARLNKPYEKVMIDELGYGGPSQAHFLMASAIQDKFIMADHVCISTDGAPDSSHPRSYGSFSKILEDYVGPPPKMSLERAVHKMSGLAAEIIGIPDRGVLARGNKADILIFVPGGVHNRATWTQPKQAPTGFDAIIVNGAVAYEDGRPDGHKHGRMLRKGKA